MSTDPDYLTFPEVMRVTRLSRPTLLRAIRAGRFPGAVKYGKDWRIPRRAVFSPE